MANGASRTGSTTTASTIGKPIRLFVTLKKNGDNMLVDWTGTNPQVRGAINNTLSYTKSASYTGIRSVLPQNIPNNEGVFRAIEVICPPGTVGNGVLPAACAARGLTGFRMVDCMYGALAMMLPDKVKAAGDGGNSGISIGGYDKNRKPFVYVEFTCGAWGARPWADGLNGNSHMFANQSCPSAEVIEAEQPVSVLTYEFVPDKIGAGKFRGGVPFRRAYRFNEQAAQLSVRSDRKTHRPFGLYGGSARPAFGEPFQSARRKPANALEGHHGYQTGRRVSAHTSRVAGAGAIRWSAIRKPSCATCATSSCRRRRRKRIMASSSTPRPGPSIRRQPPRNKPRSARPAPGPARRRCNGTIPSRRARQPRPRSNLQWLNTR